MSHGVADSSAGDEGGVVVEVKETEVGEEDMEDATSSSVGVGAPGEAGEAGEPLAGALGAPSASSATPDRSSVAVGIAVGTPTSTSSSRQGLAQKVGAIKRLLQIDVATPLLDAIAKANELLFGAGAASDQPLLAQADKLLQELGLDKQTLQPWDADGPVH